MPRNVVSGEFTRVVQRGARAHLDRQGRPLAATAHGLSARVSIAHSKGDAAWADKAAREMADQEARFNQMQPASPPARTRGRP